MRQWSNVKQDYIGTKQLYLQALIPSEGVYILPETRDFLKEKTSPNFNTCSHFRRGAHDCQILGMQQTRSRAQTCREPQAVER